VWNYGDFLYALYDDPPAAHRLLRMVTDVIIETVEELKRAFPGLVCMHCPLIWMPSDVGISISDDVMAVISPRTYAEFGVPYNRAIAEHFGGISIHSCGDISHQIDNLRQIPGLYALNYGTSETPHQAMVEALGGRVLLVVHQGLNKVIELDSPVAFVRDTLTQTPTGVPLFVVANAASPPEWTAIRTLAGRALPT